MKFSKKQSNSSSLLQQAYSLHQLGRLSDAKLIYQKILEKEPLYFNVIQLLGTLSLQQGEYQKAKNLFEKAISIDEKSAIIFNNLGITLKNLNLLNEALDCYDKAIAIDPRYVDALYNKACILHQLSNFDKAIEFYDQAIFFSPLHVKAFANRGLSFLKRHDYGKAIASIERSLSIDPNFSEAWSNLGMALYESKDFNGALLSYNKAIQFNANLKEAWSSRGVVLNKLRQFDEALKSYQKAIELNPNYEEAWSNRGMTLSEMQDFNGSLLSYNRAIEINSDYAEAWFGRAGALDNLKQLKPALASYKKALDIRPGYIDAAFNCGLMLLHNLSFAEGWIGYETRWHTQEFDSKPLLTSMPQWQGTKSDKRLFIWAEQGIGDQILYGSLLQELQQFPQKKIISLDKKLIPAFQRSFPNYEFLDKTKLPSEDLYDEQIPIGSLGQFLRKEVANFKNAAHPYLIDDPIKTQRIKLSPPFANRKTCGISWRSSNQKIGKDKSVSLLDLLPILSTHDMQFINLQYGDTAQEIANLQENHQQSIYSVPEIDIFNDIDGVLSIISACDLIITTSNSTAHLAGALGKETLLLTPYSVGKFWYWHDINGVSLWYPSVQVFPQTTLGDWVDPIDAIKAYLEKRIWDSDWDI